MTAENNHNWRTRGQLRACLPRMPNSSWPRWKTIPKSEVFTRKCSVDYYQVETCLLAWKTPVWTAQWMPYIAKRLSGAIKPLGCWKLSHHVSFCPQSLLSTSNISAYLSLQACCPKRNKSFIFKGKQGVTSVAGNLKVKQKFGSKRVVGEIATVRLHNWRFVNRPRNCLTSLLCQEVPLRWVKSSSISCRQVSTLVVGKDLRRQCCMHVQKMHQEDIQVFIFMCALLEGYLQSTIYRAAGDNPNGFPWLMCPVSLFRCVFVSGRIKFVGAHCIKVCPGTLLYPSCNCKTRILF